MKTFARKLVLLFTGLVIVALCAPEPRPRVETLASSAPVVVDVNRARRVEAWWARAERQSIADFLAAIPPPAPPRVPARRPSGDMSGDRFDRLAMCESGGDPATNTGNGFYGAFQFVLSSWHSAGGTGYPNEHSYAEQKAVALYWASVTNPYQQWPVCWPRSA